MRIDNNNRKIYLISAELVPNQVFYKIGYTKRDVNERIKEFKTGNCSNFEIIYTYTPNDFVVTIEKSLHKHFKDKKIDGEWFKLDKDDILDFPRLCDHFYNLYNDLQYNNTYIQDNGIKFK